MIKTKAGATIGTAPPRSRTFIRLRAVKAKTGLPESTIYYLQAKGDFPRSVKLSERIAAWDESEVDAWQEAKLAQRDADQAAP